jgi:hypothetical protein
VRRVRRTQLHLLKQLRLRKRLHLPRFQRLQRLPLRLVPSFSRRTPTPRALFSDFTECKRKEGVLGVKVRFRNVSSPEKYFNIISGRNYDHFYVTAANKKYFILKDSEGTYLTPSASGGGDLRVPLEHGARSVIRLIFFTSAGGAGYFAHHVYCRPCSSRDIQTVKESIFTI